MLRSLVFVFSLGIFSGCAKPDLPVVVVRASSASELTLFRTELNDRFTAEQLQPFDTAVQELKLDAMNRDVVGASAREEDMQAVINGKSVQATLILGWKARQKRLLGEIAQISALLERDLKRKQENAATGTPESVLTHLQNEQDILARLHRDLTETERQLTAWNGK